MFMPRLTKIVFCMFLTFPLSSVAEVSFSVYFGRAFTLPGEIVYKKKNGDRSIFSNVQFKDRSFDAPVYYGIRITHWLANEQQGIAMDFTHAKIYAALDREVKVEESVNGEKSVGVQRLGEYFQDLSLSHGHNYLTLNWLLRNTNQSLDVYAGAGLGLAYPHVEVSIGEDKVDEFQLTGPMFQVFTGISSHNRVPVFAEYKLSYGLIEGRLPSGSQINLRPLTHHLVSGAGIMSD